MSDPLRLRFAPSPTGRLHIGGARTALFNWAYARRMGGTFLLRIEDTDRERSTDEYERAILDGLRWLGIDWDEGPDVGGDFGPYRQTERWEQYQAVAQELLAAGHAYRCFCSSERLEELREKQMQAGETPAYDQRCRGLDPAEAAGRAESGEACVLRFRVPLGQTRLTDLIRGQVTFANTEVDDWILVRTNGSPTYNFAVVCDDSRMKITHVMRGVEHLTNTPKQVLLYEALKLTAPAFAHFPLMLGTDKKKLSKRTGDTSLEDYRDKGYPPEAVLNFLCLQGWALDDKTQVFSPDELVQNFDPTRVSKGGAIFDPEKFRWMAGEYLRKDSLEQLAERSAPFVERAGLMTRGDIEARSEWFRAALATVQERVQLYSEVPEHLAYLFAADDAVPYEEKALANARKKPAALETLAAYAEFLAPYLAAESFEAEVLSADTKAWLTERGTKIPLLFQPLRCALSGKPGGPDLFEIMVLLGAPRVAARIAAGLERIAAQAP